MEIVAADLTETQAYALFAQLVVPRPIAWVLSDNGESPDVERWNLAPFSFFNTISNAPPMVMISIGDGMAGRAKDTHRNLRARPECVIALATASQAGEVQATSADLAPGRSEARASGVALADWDWTVPRIAASPVSMAGIARQFTRVGRTAQYLAFVEVVRVWIRPGLGTLDAEGRPCIDVGAFDPLARVGRGGYARLGEVFWPRSG